MATQEELLATKVPARYKGEFHVDLPADFGPYFDGDGKVLTSLRIKQGDTLMMEKQEILGESYKYDPRGIADVLFLGYGRKVLPEDADKSDEELAALGYSFHQPRTDFEAIAPTAQESEVG